MEDWLKDAKELAKSEAEYIVKNLIDVANTNNLDAEWFVEEVVKNIQVFCLSAIGSLRYFGLTGILPVALAKYHQLLYKSTSKVKVNGYEFTRLLPPPEGSGFPPTSNERFYL